MCMWRHQWTHGLGDLPRRTFRFTVRGEGVSAYNRFSKGRWDRISNTGDLFALRAHQLVGVIKTLAASKFTGSEHAQRDSREPKDGVVHADGNKSFFCLQDQLTSSDLVLLAQSCGVKVLDQEVGDASHAQGHAHIQEGGNDGRHQSEARFADHGMERLIKPLILRPTAVILHDAGGDR